MNDPEKSGSTPRLIFALVALALLVFTAIAVGFISAGLFDPKPLGGLSTRMEPSRSIEIDGEYKEPIVVDQGLGEYSVKILSASISGSEDVGYGLQIGDAGHHVIIAVSPLGYAAIMDRRLDEKPNVGASVSPLPWQTWPHINGGRETNEIWIDVKDSNLVLVRINGELLWTGDIPLSTGNIDFWAKSFGEPGIVAIETVEIYGDE